MSGGHGNITPDVNGAVPHGDELAALDMFSPRVRAALVELPLKPLAYSVYQFCYDNRLDFNHPEVEEWIIRTCMDIQFKEMHKTRSLQDAADGLKPLVRQPRCRTAYSRS